MNESIFSRLFRYKQTEKMSPKENYLTEMLAWMIDSLPQFGQDYVLFLNSKCKEKLNFDANCPFTVSARTQVAVEDGFIDMVIITDQNLGFICEHKVDSELSNNQIKKYYDCRAEIDSNLEFQTVLLTKSKGQHEQNPDIQIIWHDVYEFFSDPIRKESYNADEKIIIEQFLMYLTEVGMGKKNSISIKGVEYYSEAQKLEQSLKVLFNDLCTDGDWESNCNGINQFLTDYSPKHVEKLGEGRIGIEFASWQPGLFAGVKLDNADHSLDSFDNTPQLVVILDCMEGERSKHQEKSWFQLIKQNAKSSSESGFQIQIGAKNNQYRLLVLYKPLTKVLSKCNEDYYEQKKTIKKWIIDGINWILNYYKLSCEDTRKEQE